MNVEGIGNAAVEGELIGSAQRETSPGKVVVVAVEIRTEIVAKNREQMAEAADEVEIRVGGLPGRFGKNVRQGRTFQIAGDEEAIAMATDPCAGFTDADG